MRSHEGVTTQVLSNLASLLPLLSSRLESVDISDSWPCAKMSVLVGSRCACTCTSCVRGAKAAATRDGV
jgi:hypothetical protein